MGKKKKGGMNSVPHHERNKWQCCLQRRKQGPFHAHLHTPSIHQRHNRSLFMGPLSRHERLPDHKHRMKRGTMKEKYPHSGFWTHEPVRHHQHWKSLFFIDGAF
ncbi:hypothetical protein CDAR_441711 [Caerostris darwini]|uniref:Uncharacterized protein n=1 Tax=Caerostris darwini TaxID=1538125 RepID=A0AAV4QML6_9ARAC|nr:hypothetical protein CDAR_441711 [Caerostris darwini]